jgi:hypothetical protein
VKAWTHLALTTSFLKNVLLHSKTAMLLKIIHSPPQPIVDSRTTNTHGESTVLAPSMYAPWRLSMPKIAKKPITLISDLVVSGAMSPATPLRSTGDHSAIMILLRTNKIAKRAPPSRASTSVLGRNLKKRHKLNFLPTVAILTVSISGLYLSMFAPLMPILVTTRSSVKPPARWNF